MRKGWRKEGRLQDGETDKEGRGRRKRGSRGGKQLIGMEGGKEGRDKGWL